MRICYVADPRSVHTRRWVGWFAGRHDVHLVRTAPSDALPDVPGIVLPRSAPLPGIRLGVSLARLRAYLRRTRPDLLHAHFINEAGWLAGFAGHRPWLLTVWGSDVYRAPGESRMAALLNPTAARRADAVTCDSADQGRALEAWGVAAERIHVVGWGVDRSRFHPGVDGAEWRRRLGIAPDARVVLSPRQWLPNSHIVEVVEAHARLPGDPVLLLKRLPAFEGDYARRVEEAIRASPASDRVHQVGEVDEGALPALYAAADVAVSLCGTDGTPVSVLEAMAEGLPVVALDVASLREWLDPGGGALVRTPDPDVVAGALTPLLSDAALRRVAGQRNVAMVAERADRAREMERAETLCRRLVGDGKAS